MSKITAEQLIVGYSQWLLRFRWNFFGVLTFRNRSLSLSKADRVFRQWISELEDADGTANFRWFRVTERGAFGDNLHFHVLVGGLRNGSRVPWVARWNELAGDALITYHFRSGGAAKYIVKTARPDRDFEIDFKLR